MIKTIAVSEKQESADELCQLSYVNKMRKKAPRDRFARGCVFGAGIGRPCAIGVPERFARDCVFVLCAGGLMRIRP